VGSTPTFGTNFIDMKITFEDKINGTSTWEPTSSDFEIHDALQAIKGMLISHGWHEWVVNEEFLSISQDIKDEYRADDNNEIIDPLHRDPQTWEELYKDNPENIRHHNNMTDNIVRNVWPENNKPTHRDED
jgi:hypothetical protein